MSNITLVVDLLTVFSVVRLGIWRLDGIDSAQIEGSIFNYLYRCL